MVVARVDVGRNVDVDDCRVGLLSLRNVEIAVVNPRIDGRFLRIDFTFGRRGAVSVVVEVVVNLNVITA